MKKILLVLLIFALTSSCNFRQKREEALNSWIGHAGREVVESWGRPTSSYESEDGVRYSTWTNEKLCRECGFEKDAEGNYNDTYYSYSKTFVIRNDTIVSWKIKGY